MTTRLRAAFEQNGWTLSEYELSTAAVLVGQVQDDRWKLFALRELGQQVQSIQPSGEDRHMPECLRP